jgi:hypothetical protein
LSLGFTTKGEYPLIEYLPYIEYSLPSMLLRQISSSLTAFHKFFLPGIFILSLVNLGIMALRGDSFAVPPDMPFWLLPLIAIAFLLSSVWMSWPLKIVKIDDNNLYVSNYQKELTIPIAEISKVTEFIFSEPRRITIHLKTSTDFGQKIVFLGTYRFFAFFTPHPIVAELRKLIKY